MISKLSKTALAIAIIITIVWGFSDSYSSHSLDNIVHVVAIGVDKSSDEENNLKVSFQFVNMSSGGEGSSGGEASTIVTSISSTTINKAINLMNSYIGKELNFAHCKVIVFSEEFAREGISTEICTFINNEEIRPSTNIIISTSDAHSYLKNSNPNIEKIVTNYYETFELTSNFTGYSEDTTIGEFYNKLMSPHHGNTAILGRTFKKVSNSESADSSQETNPQTGENSKSSSQNQNSEGSAQEKNSSSSSESEGQNQGSDSQNKEASQSGANESDNKSQSSESESTSQSSQNSGANTSQEQSGKNSGGNTDQTDSGGATLDISGERGTQNVGIAVFKDDKYVGELSEIESICHLLITNNVDSFVISLPAEGYPDNLLDLNIQPLKSTKIKVDTSSNSPTINIAVYCEARVLTIDKNSNYEDSKVLKDISQKAHRYLKEQIENYLEKTTKKFNSDIAGFIDHATKNFLTQKDLENYDWSSKYENSNFNVDVKVDVMSSLLFSGN